MAVRLHPKADMFSNEIDVRFVPSADIGMNICSTRQHGAMWTDHKPAIEPMRQPATVRARGQRDNWQEGRDYAPGKKKNVRPKIK